jgi:hypothetical protein
MVRRECFLVTVRTKASHHLFRELGKGKFRPKVRNVPCTGVAVSFFGHGRLGSSLSAIICQSRGSRLRQGSGGVEPPDQKDETPLPLPSAQSPVGTYTPPSSFWRIAVSKTLSVAAAFAVSGLRRAAFGIKMGPLLVGAASALGAAPVGLARRMYSRCGLGGRTMTRGSGVVSTTGARFRRSRLIRKTCWDSGCRSLSTIERICRNLLISASISRRIGSIFIL